MFGLFRGVMRAVDGPYLDSGGDPGLFILFFVVVSILVVIFRILRGRARRNRKPPVLKSSKPLSEKEKRAREKERREKVARQARSRKTSPGTSSAPNPERTPEKRPENKSQSTKEPVVPPTPATVGSQQKPTAEQEPLQNERSKSEKAKLPRSGESSAQMKADPEDLIRGYPSTAKALFAYVEEKVTRESDPALVFLRDNSSLDDLQSWVELYQKKPSIILWGFRVYLRRHMHPQNRAFFESFKENRLVAEELRRLPKG